MSRSKHDTSPTLLRRAADWSDRSAWSSMHERYDSLIDRWSRKCLENRTDVIEFKQILWIEIARRIVDFRYDPQGSFRSWLKTLHSSRIADFRKAAVRAARREQGYREFACRANRLAGLAYETATAASESGALTTSIRDRHELDQERLARASEAVRSRFRNRSWEVFWSIAMEDRSIAETASEFGMSYAAAFAAYTRVRNALRTELEKAGVP